MGVNKKISELDSTSAKDALEFPVNDNGVTKKVTYQNIKGIKSSSGAADPVSTPDSIGDIYINTTTKRTFIAVGTGSSADWQKQGVFASGTITVTAGGGDITVNLPFNWVGGYVHLHSSSNLNNYFAIGVGDRIGFYSSYEAISNGLYTNAQTIEDRSASTPQPVAKGAGNTGNINAVTTTSFTMDDDGINTRYIKWFVWA